MVVVVVVAWGAGGDGKNSNSDSSSGAVLDVCDGATSCAWALGMGSLQSQPMSWLRLACDGGCRNQK